jgi:putative spermidine/putrescine transport system substrate-binding protein
MTTNHGNTNHEGETVANERLDASHRWSRRRFIGASAGVLGSAALLAACGDDGGSSTSGGSGTSTSGGASAADLGVDEITLTNWGGSSSDAMVRAWVDPFEEETGIRVNVVSPTDYGKIRSQVDSGKVTWDVVDVEGFYLYSGEEQGTTEPLDKEALGVTEADFVPGLPDPILPNGVVNYLTAYVIAYNSEAKAWPRSWAEFFDPSEIKGKRMIYNWPYGMLEIALLGDGVSFDELYPLDVERAFAKLDAIKGDLTFWNTGAESQQALVSGSADFVVPWNNRAGFLANGGLPVAIEWAENLQIRGGMVVPRGAPGSRAANAFIGLSLQPERQAEMALGSGYGPVVTAANDLVDERIRPYLSTTPENLEKAVGWIDDKWWAENLTEVSEQWTNWASS